MTNQKQNQDQLNQDTTEHSEGAIEDLLEKQDYLDFIDNDMQSYYAVKAERIAPQ